MAVSIHNARMRISFLAVPHKHFSEVCMVMAILDVPLVR